jgi:hypothetical protein
MGFNTDAEKFWRAVIWLTVIGIIGGIVWWVVASAKPDEPFQAWLMNASRNDVWGFAFGIILSGVAAGRIITSSSK